MNKGLRVSDGAGAGCSEHRPSACSGSPQGATAPRFSKKAPQGPHPRLKDPVPVRKTRPDLRSLPPNTQQNQANLGGSERDPSVEKAWEEHQQAELRGLWRQRAHPGGCLPQGAGCSAGLSLGGAPAGPATCYPRAPGNWWIKSPRSETCSPQHRGLPVSCPRPRASAPEEFRLGLNETEANISL